jgi:hypothetical protein
MNGQALAKFDPSQTRVPLTSSSGSSLLPKNEGGEVSTAGLPDEQLFVDPVNIPSQSKPLFDANPLHLDATVFLGNRRVQEDASPSVVFLRRKPIVQHRFVLLQKWEGTVLQVLPEDSLFARLVDLSGSGPDEEAEFSLEEVSEADRLLVAPGAIFYWSIGYIDSLSGQRTRSSVIRFRRLPVWRAEDLERARRRAQRLSDLLGWK